MIRNVQCNAYTSCKPVMAINDHFC